MRFVREELWYRLPLAVRILLIPFLIVGGAVGYILYALLFPLIAVVLLSIDIYKRVAKKKRRADDGASRF